MSYKLMLDGVWEAWQRRNNRHQCCDCRLIHRFDTRIVVKGGRQIIEQRLYRDDVATDRARKRAKIKVTQGK